MYFAQKERFLVSETKTLCIQTHLFIGCLFLGYVQCIRLTFFFFQVLLLHSDPRSVLFSRQGQQDNKEELPLSETANRICSQMVNSRNHKSQPLINQKVRDQQRLEEFGTGPNMRAVALFSEELFLVQVFNKFSIALLSQFFTVQKSSSSFGNLLGSSKAGF